MKKHSRMQFWGVVLTIAVIASLAMGSQAQALIEPDPYTIDFNEIGYTSSISGTFTTLDYSEIGSSELSIYLMGRNTYYNSRGYGWYYDTKIDVLVNGTSRLSSYSPTGSWEMLTFQLNPGDISQLIAESTLSFTVQGLETTWYSDLSPWGGWTTSTFFADYAILAVSPNTAAVPVPAAVWLLGSGLVGLVGLRRKLIA